MAVMVSDLAEYVNASSAEPALPELLTVASTLVSEYLGGRVSRVPAAVLDHATLQLGSELWARRNSPGGVAQWGPDGQPVRLSRDVLVSVRSLLQPYRGLGTVG